METKIIAGQAEFQEKMMDMLDKQMKSVTKNSRATGTAHSWGGQERATSYSTRPGSREPGFGDAAGGSRRPNDTRKRRKRRDYCAQGENTEVRFNCVLGSIPPSVRGHGLPQMDILREGRASSRCIAGTSCRHPTQCHRRYDMRHR